MPRYLCKILARLAEHFGGHFRTTHGVCIPPVPATVNMHQFSHSVRLSNYEITCEWLFRLCSSMWRALDSWAKRRVTPGWSCFSDRSLLLNGMVCGQLVQFCVSTFYSIRMLYDHSCNSTEFKRKWRHCDTRRSRMSQLTHFSLTFCAVTRIVILHSFCNLVLIFNYIRSLLFCLHKAIRQVAV